MTQLTPRQIVAELNRFVVGQLEAKKAVAIALRNRWRRKQVDESMRDEIVPHNILMVGPTGVGKTEIARRLARLSNAPFIKVEATKFTEVGYVGRDVDSIVRDLVDISINMTRQCKKKEVEEQATKEAEDRIINALVGESAAPETKAKFYERYKKGELDDTEIEVKVSDNAPTGGSMPTFDIPGMPGSQMGVLNIGDMLNKALGGKKQKTMKLKVKDAIRQLIQDESEKLIDEEKIIKEAIYSVENDGIVFLDEIDKIASKSSQRGEVSREGVQRDLLPLIEGTTVSTKYGPVKTDHILFIASGAFHIAKPSDLLPELQGRLPIRVELNPLSEADMISILTEPEHSLPKQYKALFSVEHVEVEFTDEGIAEIAKIATEINRDVEDIGARRLHTLIEKLLQEINYNASDSPHTKVLVDKEYVGKNLGDLTRFSDLSKFIL